MSTNCLVTKLKAVVDNPNLPYLYDYSFTLNGTNYADYFVNPSSQIPDAAGSGNNVATTVYFASQGDSHFTTQDTANRFVTDYIEVIPNMTVKGSWCRNTDAVPSVVCFGANKNVVEPANSTNAAWSTGGYSFAEFTIPSGVKYIKIQTSNIDSSFSVVGKMPEL